MTTDRTSAAIVPSGDSEPAPPLSDATKGTVGTHLHLGGACVTICRTPMECIREEDAGVRWCFGCRQHLPHTARLMATVEPSYYEPHWSVTCARCGQDRTRFPGTEW